MPEGAWLTHGSHYCLYAGRIEHVKGTDVLVDAIKQTIAAHQKRDIRFVFAETTLVQKPRFERNIDEKLQKGRERRRYCSLQGASAKTEMPKYYAAADFVVLPSRNEATSLTALESMACATRGASSVGGLIQIIEDGHDGHL